MKAKKFVNPHTVDAKGLIHLKGVAKDNKKMLGGKFSFHLENAAKNHGFKDWNHAISCVKN